MTDYTERICRLRGTPFEVGYALGRALGPRLESNIERFIRARVPRGVPPRAERWRAGALPWLESLPARFREEFAGLSQATGVPLQRLGEWTYLEVLLAGGCSGAIVALDGHPWVARNNDFIAPDLWGYAAVREVTGRIPTLTFGLEGDIFTSTGINRERLWLHYNYLPILDASRPVEEENRAPSAPLPLSLPCYAFMVEALETCRDLPALETLLARLPRHEAMLLFALDGKTDAYALYECGPAEVVKREPERGWLVGTNHYVAHPQASRDAGLEPRGPLHTARRYRRMEALVADLAGRDAGLESRDPAGSAAQDLARILADDGIEARGAGGSVTVYANVACPATGEVWHTFGGHPAASRGDWRRLAWPW